MPSMLGDVDNTGDGGDNNEADDAANEEPLSVATDAVLAHLFISPTAAGKEAHVVDEKEIRLICRGPFSDSI